MGKINCTMFGWYFWSTCCSQGLYCLSSVNKLGDVRFRLLHNIREEVQLGKLIAQCAAAFLEYWLSPRV